MRGALVQRADVEAIARRIRDVPDFPKPGIVFKDITPLLLDATAFRRAVELMTAPFRRAKIARVVSIEARGCKASASRPCYTTRNPPTLQRLAPVAQVDRAAVS